LNKVELSRVGDIRIEERFSEACDVEPVISDPRGSLSDRPWPAVAEDAASTAQAMPQLMKPLSGDVSRHDVETFGLVAAGADSLGGVGRLMIMSGS
jgi:hypothetical protein